MRRCFPSPYSSTSTRTQRARHLRRRRSPLLPRGRTGTPRATSDVRRAAGPPTNDRTSRSNRRRPFELHERTQTNASALDGPCNMTTDAVSRSSMSTGTGCGAKRPCWKRSEPRKADNPRYVNLRSERARRRASPHDPRGPRRDRADQAAQVQVRPLPRPEALGRDRRVLHGRRRGGVQRRRIQLRGPRRDRRFPASLDGRRDVPFQPQDASSRDRPHRARHRPRRVGARRRRRDDRLRAHDPRLFLLRGRVREARRRMAHPPHRLQARVRGDPAPRQRRRASKLTASWWATGGRSELPAG